MDNKLHCEKSLELFDEDGAQIHSWLDSYASVQGWSHRMILHNKEGIEIGVMIFGEGARKHLTQHIMDDYMCSKANIPTCKEIRNDPEAFGFIGEKVK